MPGDQLALEFRNVTFGYDKKKPLLRDLSLQIHPNERVALIGSNGSGKSTIVRLALGLEVPHHGHIRLLDKIVSWGAHFPNVGYVGDPSQSDDGLGLPLWLTVKEITEIHHSLLGDRLPVDFSQAIHERLALSALWNREIRSLSSGERRRLMTYLALAKAPKLLITDEATEIISARERPTIVECVNDCCNTFGTALLWISHDSDSTAQIADRVLRLEDGQALPLPEREFLLTMRKDDGAETSKWCGECRALFEIRSAIENYPFQRLTFTLEHKVSTGEHNDY